MDKMRPWFSKLTFPRLLFAILVVAGGLSAFLVQFNYSDLWLLVLVAPILLLAHYARRRYYLLVLFPLTALAIWVIMVTSNNLTRSFAILAAIFAGVLLVSEFTHQISALQWRTPGGLYVQDHWFRSIFADSPIAIELFDREGRLIDVNRAGLLLFGVNSVEDVRGFQLFDDPNVTDEVKARLRRGETVHYTNRFDFESVKAAKLYETERSGVIDLDVLITPLGFQSDALPEGYLVQAQDVSERNRAAAALQASEERYRILAEMSSDSFAIQQVTKDGARHSEWCTADAFVRLTGYSLPELAALGSDLGRLVLSEDRAQAQMDASPGLGTVRQEFRLRRKDGEIRWIRQRYRFEHNAEGRPTTLYLAAEDVTDLKEVEQQALAFRLEKEQTRLLTAFIQNASHEFRTPLSVLGLDLHWLARRSDDAHQPRLARMDEQVKIISDLVDALLTLSTLDSEAPLEFTTVNLETLLADLVDQQQAIAEQVGVHLSLDMPERLPALSGSPYYLSLALQTLVDNGLRYTPSGGQVTVHAATADDGVARISIIDTGVGITADALPKIFDRFYRVDEAHSTQGFGLGLPIAQKVAERHGGRVWVQSDIGAGSRFVMELPIGDDAMMRSK